MNYPTFFLSHSSKDVKLEEQFMNLLRLGMNLGEQDIFCTSENDIKIGTSYIDIIKNNLTGAKVVIMLISKNYMASPFCLCEMGYAWASDITILPLLVNVDFKDVEYPTTPLKATQMVKLSDKKELTSTYDYLKDNGLIKVKTNSFNKQLELFLNSKVWLNPEGDSNPKSESNGLKVKLDSSLKKGPDTGYINLADFASPGKQSLSSKLGSPFTKVNPITGPSTTSNISMPLPGLTIPMPHIKITNHSSTSHGKSTPIPSHYTGNIGQSTPTPMPMPKIGSSVHISPKKTD